MWAFKTPKVKEIEKEWKGGKKEGSKKEGTEEKKGEKGKGKKKKDRKYKKGRRKREKKEMSCLTSHYTTKLQSSRQYGTGTKTET